MGNSQSNEQPKSGPSNSAASTSAPASPATRQQAARRQDSVPVSTHGTTRSSHAPPTAALISTSSSASTSTQPTRAHAHAHVTPSPNSSHTRARSITAPGSAPLLKPDSPANSQRSASPAMGSDQSYLRPPSRSSTLPIAAPESQGGKSESQPRPVPSPSPVSKPVDVPTSSHPHPPNEPFALPPDDSPYSHAPSNYNRPPRLPLPIEEEVHTPGSPIITSQDVTSPIDEKEDDGLLPRRTSILSHTTVDDDEIVDHDMFTSGESLAPTVPTTIEWKGAGEKVYVTGTFVMWEKKFKLHRNKDTGFFSATLQLKPGTHHIKFLVDADMVTSDDLPTTVDFTNILVNYVEVVAPMPSTGSTQPSVPAQPIPIPGASATADEASAKGGHSGKPAEAAMQEAETPSFTPQPPQTQKSQPIPVPESQHGPSPPSPKTKSERPQQQQQIKPPKQAKKPRPEYTTQIPQYEADYDLTFSDADPERSQRVKSLLNTLPQPPSLPLFLAKSILNGTTPHKDDASVLIMPNHTVLNHLATSSIKNQVLATSGTTRYKRKFLTTIMYKPTTDAG